MNPTIARRLPGASILLAAVAGILAFSSAASSWLEYDRHAIAAGEIWRFVSGHWTHTSTNHFFWDVVVFLFLGTQCERLSRSRFWMTVAGSAVSISTVLWFGRPDLNLYRGLSGIDSALFSLLLVIYAKRLIGDNRLWAAMALSLLGIAFACKTVYEWNTAKTVFVDNVAAGMFPVVSAHVVGAAVGALVGLLPDYEAVNESTRPLL